MGCETIAKLILIVVNIIFFLLGAAALGVGIWVVVDAAVFLDVLSNIPAEDGKTNTYGSLIKDAAYILIAGGAAIFLIAFLGCCGAWKKQKCLLMTYAIIIGLILCLEIGCVVAGYFFWDNIETTVLTAMASGLNSKYDSQFTNTSATEFAYTPGNSWSKGVDAIQIELQCCGINNYTDFRQTDPTAVIPVTCCKTSAGDSLSTLVDSIWKGDTKTLTIANAACWNNETYITVDSPGCKQQLVDLVMNRSTLFIGIAAGTAGVQLFLVFLACCLFCVIRKEESKP